jgi:Uncharacterized protein conserved in bacteria (DUF2330)
MFKPRPSSDRCTYCWFADYTTEAFLGCRMDDMRIVATLVILILLPGSIGLPCAPAPPDGHRVQVLGESAVIVWDSKNNIEHFIRSATFESDSPDFGFLVPTPSIPALEESSDEIFRMTEDWMVPEKIEKNMYGIAPIFILGAFLMLRSRGNDELITARPPVRVLTTQQVSGYDAVVLEADNATALQNWLNEHHYAARPDLIAWFEPYIQKKWKICAFKIAYRSTGEAFATSPVKMSFQTDQPFFPYREPSNQRDKNQEQHKRVLRLYVFSDSKMDAKIGDSGSWPGKIVWSDRLNASEQSAALDKLKIDSGNLPMNLWMTTLEDESSPRPGTDDLYFIPAKDQNRKLFPPIEIKVDKRVPLPIDLLIVVALIVILIRRRRRKLA